MRHRRRDPGPAGLGRRDRLPGRRLRPPRVRRVAGVRDADLRPRHGRCRAAGCPIDPGQLLELLTALFVGRRPQLPDEAVCLECKRRNAVCVAVARRVRVPRPGHPDRLRRPVPAYGRGCYGCFGPREAANANGLARHLRSARVARRRRRRLFAGFTACSEPFRSCHGAGRGGRAGRRTRHGRPGSSTMHGTLDPGRPRRRVRRPDGHPRGGRGLLRPARP